MRAAGQQAYAQCTLATARNLLRNTNLTAAELARWRIPGIRETNEIGEPEIRFIDWGSLLENTCHANQVIVRGNPSIWSEIGTWRHMIRAAAWSNTHVVALIYNDAERRFLLYDNDSEERKNGQPGVKTEQELRGYEFEGLVAVTEKGSALERQSKEHRREVYEELDDSEDSERIDETWRRFVGD